MNVLDFVKPVSTWDAERVRAFLEERHPDTLLVLDVRQEGEYARGHLPGALHIPLDSLHDRLGELPSDRTILVYCASGLRSHAAAALLARAGLADVHHLAGGLHAWRGGLAVGSPLPELERFRGFASPEQQVALAWHLEEETRSFYGAVRAQLAEGALAALVEDLGRAEERHKATLRAVWEGLAARPAPADFPRPVLGEAAPAGLLEGGIPREAALAWVGEGGARAVCDVAMTIEVSALDRYLHLQRHLPDENSRRAFEVLAGEERRHLRRLAAALEALD